MNLAARPLRPPEICRKCFDIWQTVDNSVGPIYCPHCKVLAVRDSTAGPDAKWLIAENMSLDEYLALWEKFLLEKQNRSTSH